MNDESKIEQSESPIILVDKNGIPMTQQTQEDILERVASLPASQPDIVAEYTRLISEHPISIIRAETGAGKTTQIPKQVRLKTWRRVNVTQPRVLAAIGNGSRVAQELLAQEENPKYTINYGEVWYRFAGAKNAKTSLLSFNTWGLELMRQFHSDLVPDILFLDEAHHFGKDIEILMWLFKFRNDIQKRLVIMSATIEPDVFQDYFGNKFWEIPVLDIPWRTFPVKKYFHSNPDEASFITMQLLSEWKSGLFFVSGKWEIESLIKKFREMGVEIPIYPLHAELTEEEQVRAVVNPWREQRLIIATNVAEESITPEGIHFVIDLWTHKMSYPNKDGIETLVKENISKANSEQRAGRAGRIEEGEYHRFNKEGIDDIDAYPLPPISKEMLDREILLFLNSWRNLKSLMKESEKKGERLFSHDIDTGLLPISYQRLELIGAIDKEWRITNLWRDLLSLNLEVYHARMLLQAIQEWCVEEMIYAVCILSTKWFLGTNEQWKKLFDTTRMWKRHTDIIYYMKLLIDFSSRKSTKAFTNKLAGMGIDYLQLEEFHSQTWAIEERKMLFEMVDLSPIWVKNEKITEILNLIWVIQKRLEWLWVRVDSNHEIKIASDEFREKIQAIQICFFAGYPFFTGVFSGKEKRIKSKIQEWGIWNLLLQQAKTSIIQLQDWKDYSFFPFIIEWDGQAKDLELANFISEVPDGAEKDAQEFATSYQSSKKTKWKNSITSPSQLDERYLAILTDLKQLKDEDDYLSIVVPYILLTQNHNFRKFIENNPWKIEEMIQRVWRFLLRNKDSYKHRINQRDIKKTERSFWHDADIYGDFRWWEKSYVWTRKREQKLSPKEHNEAHTVHQLSLLRKEFIALCWWYYSWRYKVDLSWKQEFILGKISQEYLSENPELNELLSFEQSILKRRNEEEIKDICRWLSLQWKQKTAIVKLREYNRYIQNIISELEKLSKWDNAIDVDFLLWLIESRYFKWNSRSQKDKYKKTIWILSWKDYRRLSSPERKDLETVIINLLKKIQAYITSLSQEKDSEWNQKNKNKIRTIRWIQEKLESALSTNKYMWDDEIENIWGILWEQLLTKNEVSWLLRAVKQLREWKKTQVSDRKRLHAIGATRQMINSLEAKSKNISIEIQVKQDEYDQLSNIEEAKQLRELVEDFLYSILDNNYIEENIDAENIHELVRLIFRNSIHSEHEIIDIFIKFLKYKNALDKIKNQRLRDFLALARDYRDTVYVIETSYTSEASSQEIKNERDIDVMKNTIDVLKNSLQSLKSLQQKIAAV